LPRLERPDWRARLRVRTVAWTLWSLTAPRSCSMSRNSRRTP